MDTTMKANLHLHSKHSDGSLWPIEIAKLLAETGVEAASLTDHDTLGGSEEFLAACGRFGIRAYLGCEIDCVAPEIGYKSEILAYFPDGDAHHTRHFLKGVSVARYARIREFVERSRAIFSRSDLDFAELCSNKIGDRYDSFDPEDFSFNKVDVFTYLHWKGALPGTVQYREFKKAYFDTDIISDSKFPKPHVRDIAKVVRSDGGVLVVPHIGHEFSDSFDRMTRELDRLKRVIAFFREAGVGGIERYYYRNADTAAINDLVASLADGFFLTSGSDCHGPGSGKYTIKDFSGAFSGFPEDGAAPLE